LAAVATISSIGREPACDSAHSVAERMPLRQYACTGPASDATSTPNCAACSSVTLPVSTGR
jgi:hypothetical protein